MGATEARNGSYIHKLDLSSYQPTGNIYTYECPGRQNEKEKNFFRQLLFSLKSKVHKEHN